MLAALLLGCSPTVRVEAPKEPIEINRDVTERKELEDLFEEDSELF